MKNWSVSTKLITITFIGGVGSVVLVAWLSVSHGTSALLEQQTNALEAVRRSRQAYIENYFDIIREQVRNFARDEMIANATESFSRAFASVTTQVGESAAPDSTEPGALERYYEGEFRPRLEATGWPWQGTEHYIPTSAAARVLQAMYIADNPHPVGAKHLLDAAAATCDYNRLHRRFHPTIREYLSSFGYYDIFLFDLDGNLVYSVFKETDFATNFLTGPYGRTNFAEVYRLARKAPAGETVIRDFEPYGPSYGAPASFIGSPVFQGDTRLGVAVFQMPVDKINEIMSNVAGLGASGETYLIGNDMLMRSNSRFSEQSTILAQDVNTDAARQAQGGESGTMQQIDYRGVEVLASYGPLQLAGLDWAILAEVDMAEITAPAVILRNRIIGYGVILATVVGLLTALFLRRLVIRPVQQLADGAQRVEAGDYSTLVDIQTSDEIGNLARAFNHMTESISRDIDERKRTAKVLERQSLEANLVHRAAEMAVETEVIDDALQHVVDLVCEMTGWPVGHCYEPDTEQDLLTSTTIWYMNDPQAYAVFREVTEQTSFRRGEGLPGRILESGEPAWIANVQVDPNFPRNKLARNLGVKGAFGFPVKIGDEIVAVLEFFSNRELAPDDGLLQIMRNVGAQLGRVFERKQAHEALTAAHGRMKRDLEAAARVQQALLPGKPPAAVDYGFAWRYRPCDELAGDSLNVFTIDGRHVGLYILDVSGHGVPAALVSVTANHRLGQGGTGGSLVTDPIPEPPGYSIARPPKVAERLNSLYQMADHGNHYFTMVYGVLDMHDHKLGFTAAGHPGPILIRPGEDAKHIESSAFPIGIVPEAEYEELTIDLKPGDRVYFYSDGINEEKNPDRVEYGHERLREALASYRDLTLDESLDALVDAIIAWRGDDAFSDDVSVLGLERVPE